MTRVATLGRTDLDVFPLCLGGNVFGWTADEPQSHAVLDAHAGAVGNFVDTRELLLEVQLAQAAQEGDDQQHVLVDEVERELDGDRGRG